MTFIGFKKQTIHNESYSDDRQIFFLIYKRP